MTNEEVRRLLINDDITKVSLYMHNILRSKFYTGDSNDWLQEINLFILTEKNKLITEPSPAGYIYQSILRRILDTRNRKVVHDVAVANLQYLIRNYASTIASEHTDKACWDKVMESATSKAETLKGNQRREWEAMVRVVVGDDECAATWLMKRLSRSTFFRHQKAVKDFLKENLFETLATYSL